MPSVQFGRQRTVVGSRPPYALLASMSEALRESDRER
jgi:hypothetical protein